MPEIPSTKDFADYRRFTNVPSWFFFSILLFSRTSLSLHSTLTREIDDEPDEQIAFCALIPQLVIPSACRYGKNDCRLDILQFFFYLLPVYAKHAKFFCLGEL